MKKLILASIFLFAVFSADLSGWFQVRALDGGDMHLVYRIPFSGTLLLSHNFGGVWRRGENDDSWELVLGDEMVGVYFLSAAACGGRSTEPATRDSG